MDISFGRIGAVLDDGLLLVEGKSGKIISANPAAVRLLATRLVVAGPFGEDAKIAGRKLGDFLTNPGIKTAIAGLDAGGSPDAVGGTTEIVSGIRDDKFTQVRVRLAALPDGRIAVALTDMTRAHSLEKVRRDFVANVSHELRSPLTSLVGFIETMRASPDLDDATRARFLGIMDEETKRMSRLIDDLLSLSRVEVEEHIAPTEKIYIVNVVQSVVATLCNRANMEGHSIVFCDRRRRGDDSVTILGETDEIMELFHNLLDNALKYGTPGSEIRVVLTQDGRENLRFDVINEGEGIGAEHIERLTERFYRVDRARSRKKGGTGLGLAIVKHIVSRHRGQLAITSKPRGQTVFSVTLPVAVS